MNFVYAVVHRRIVDNDNLSNSESKFIGFYATLVEAGEVTASLRSVEGFKDHPSGFAIHEIAVDQVSAATGLMMNG